MATARASESHCEFAETEAAREVLEAASELVGRVLRVVDSLAPGSVEPDALVVAWAFGRRCAGALTPNEFFMDVAQRFADNDLAQSVAIDAFTAAAARRAAS